MARPGIERGGELAAILIVGGSAVLGDQLELPLIVTVAVVALSIVVLLVVRAINSTVITVAGGNVSVRHQPIPWLSHTIAAASIEQLYVDRRPVAQKRFDYNVRVKLDDGEDIKFLRSLNEPLVALYLEQCIESHLQIVDRAVAGEYQHRYSQHDPQRRIRHSRRHRPNHSHSNSRPDTRLRDTRRRVDGLAAHHDPGRAPVLGGANASRPLPTGRHVRPRPPEKVLAVEG